MYDFGIGSGPDKPKTRPTNLTPWEMLAIEKSLEAQIKAGFIEELSGKALLTKLRGADRIRLS